MWSAGICDTKNGVQKFIGLRNWNFSPVHHFQKAVVSSIVVECEPNMLYFEAEILMFDSKFLLYNLCVSKILKNRNVYFTLNLYIWGQLRVDHENHRIPLKTWTIQL